MQTIRVTTSQNIDIDYVVASLGDRIAARIIDYGIFFCIYTIFIIVVMAIKGDVNEGESALNGRYTFAIILIVWLVACVFYDLLTEIFLNGQSLGKRSLKIKVISLNGARPRVGQYILRWLFRIIDFGITLGSAGVVMVAFSDHRQRIGDMVAGTTVIKIGVQNQFKDLVFNQPATDYEPVYNEAMQLTDQDVILIHDVIRIFNRTRNNNLIYRLALKVKAHLHVTYPSEINEYQFLEIVMNDYNYLAANSSNA